MKDLTGLEPWNLCVGTILKAFEMCSGETLGCYNQKLIVDSGGISEKHKAKRNNSITLNFWSHKGDEVFITTNTIS